MKILAIVSGGLDSISIGGIYNKRDYELTFMTFKYGQKGVREIEVVRYFSERYNIPILEIDISGLKFIFGDNQLSGEVEIKKAYEQSVVVPLRNAIFLQIAMVYAYTNKFDKILIGSHLGDIEEIKGEMCYPDCSPIFLKAFELAMDLGTFRGDKKVKIESPGTLGWDKVELIKKGYEAWGNDIYKTWSCYQSGEKHCGECESCINRKRDFARANVQDLTEYEK